MVLGDREAFGEAGRHAGDPAALDVLQHNREEYLEAQGRRDARRCADLFPSAKPGCTRVGRCAAAGEHLVQLGFADAGPESLEDGGL